MKTYNIDFSGNKSFSDISSSSNFVQNYIKNYTTARDNGHKAAINVIYGKSNDNWFNDYYPETKTKYKYVFDMSTPKASIPVTYIYDYTKDYDDYDFYTSDGKKITITDNWIKIGFTIIPIKKFDFFNFIKKNDKKKEIIINISYK